MWMKINKHESTVIPKAHHRKKVLCERSCANTRCHSRQQSRLFWPSPLRTPIPSAPHVKYSLRSQPRARHPVLWACWCVRVCDVVRERFLHYCRRHTALWGVVDVRVRTLLLDGTAVAHPPPSALAMLGVRRRSSSLSLGSRRLSGMSVLEDPDTVLGETAPPAKLASTPHNDDVSRVRACPRLCITLCAFRMHVSHMLPAGGWVDVC